MAKRKKKKKFQPHKSKQVNVSLQDAVDSMNQDDLDVALKQASEYLKIAKDPTEKGKVRQVLTEVRFRMAMKSQEPDEKQTHLTSALQLEPDDARLHFHLGIALLQLDNAKDAVQEFDLVAKTEPQREGLSYFRQLARLAIQQPLHKTAKLSEAEANTLTLIQLFQEKPTKKVLKTTPEGPFVGSSKIWEPLFTMRHDKKYACTEAFQQVTIPLDQKAIATTFRYYQGVSAMREGQTEVAHGIWQKMLTKGYSASWLHKNIGISRRQELLDLFNEKRWLDIEEKGREFDGKLGDEAVNQMISLALFHSGYEQAEQERWAPAIKCWKAAADRSYNRYLAQNLAIALENIGKTEEAASAWRDVLRRRPRSKKHPEAFSDKHVSAIWAHISDHYWDAYDDSEAVNCLRKAIEYDAENVELRFRLVTTLMSKEPLDEEGGIKELNGILEIDAKNIRALTELAHIYHHNWRYDEMPIWKRILDIEPDNAEAQKELSQRYIEKAMPWEKAGQQRYYRDVPFKEQLKILNEGLEVLPDNADLVLALGWAHIDAKKHKEAKDYLDRAYELGSHDLHIVGSILQNWIIVKAEDQVEQKIPEIQQHKNLMPTFWVEQGMEALTKNTLAWAERFFNVAIEQIQYAPPGSCSKASVLVDIWMSIPPNKKAYQKLKTKFLKRIEKEVPDSGAVEYTQGFLLFSEKHDVDKALRLLRKAKKIAAAAQDTEMLHIIEMAESKLTMPPPMPGGLLDMLDGMNPKMLEDFLEKMGGFDEEPFF